MTTAKNNSRRVGAPKLPLLDGTPPDEKYLMSDDVARGAVGTWAELRACSWAIEQGYFVFRNQSPHGPADLALMTRDGKVILVDVKSSTWSAARNIWYSNALKERQLEIGVRRLVVSRDGRCCIDSGVETKVFGL